MNDPDARVDNEPQSRPRRSWGIDHWGNRLLYSVLAGMAINLTTGIYALGTTVAVVLFVLTSAIIAAGRSR